MSWFPLFVDLGEKPCLVAGGGGVALRKAELLVSFDARVTVVSKEFLPEFHRLSAALIRREVRPGDARGMALVVDATADPAAGELLAAECGRQGIPLNVVDKLELCSCIFPALLRRGPLLAAVGTGGASPMAAAWARDRLDEALPERFEEILEQMRSLRARVKTEIADPARRAALLKRCFVAAVERDCPLSIEELSTLWAETRC